MTHILATRETYKEYILRERNYLLLRNRANKSDREDYLLKERIRVNFDIFTDCTHFSEIYFAIYFIFEETYEYIMG